MIKIKTRKTFLHLWPGTQPAYHLGVMTETPKEGGV